MACLFCQNYPISQMGAGNRISFGELAERLLSLERKGAHNVNFVTPTPHVPQLIAATRIAREGGFSLPVVYNTGGYDSADALALLDGIVDIYLPDMKYRSEEISASASGTPGYPSHNADAIREMFRQRGFLRIGEDGIATGGVLVRHLVLPGRAGETRKVLAYLRREYGREVPISLMGQYFPAYRAAATPGYTRKLGRVEYERAVSAASRLGLQNVYIQEI